MNLFEYQPYDAVVTIIVVGICLVGFVASLIIDRPKPLTEEQKADLLARKIIQRRAARVCLSQHDNGIFCNKDAGHDDRHEAVVPQGYDPYYQTIYW